MVDVKNPRKFGASIQPKYVHRDVPVYGVSRLEIEQISSLNNTSATYFSLTGIIVGYAVGIWTNAAFYDGALTPVGSLAARFLAPGMCLIAVVFVFLALQARSQRQSLIKSLTSTDDDEA
jgi:hypothetical protein